MTKKEIVKKISDEMDLTQLKTKEIVQRTFDAIVDTLVTERRIELRNFGVFEVKKRAARNARNPRTNESVNVEAKYVVTFKPGKEMEERVRRLVERENAERGTLDGGNVDGESGRGTPPAHLGHGVTAPASDEATSSESPPEPPRESPARESLSHAGPHHGREGAATGGHSWQSH